MRRLADALGRSPSGVHDELRRLAASGLITAASGPRGTVLSCLDRPSASKAGGRAHRSLVRSFARKPLGNQRRVPRADQPAGTVLEGASLVAKLAVRRVACAIICSLSGRLASRNGKPWAAPAVLMIEAGGGLSLALGMALGAAPAGRTETPVDAAVSEPKRPQTPPMDALVDAPASASVQPSIASRHQCPPGVHAGDLTAWLRAKGGAAQTSMRRLALELGRSPAGVHVEIGRLAAAGVLTAVAGPRGTVLTLAAGARPN